jgi:hypothetical protein
MAKQDLRASIRKWKDGGYIVFFPATHGQAGIFSTKAEAQSYINRWRDDFYKEKSFKNPRSLLFRSRAAALKYAREHGAKKFSIKKLKRGK